MDSLLTKTTCHALGTQLNLITTTSAHSADTQFEEVPANDTWVTKDREHTVLTSTANSDCINTSHCDLHHQNWDDMKSAQCGKFSSCASLGLRIKGNCNGREKVVHMHLIHSALWESDRGLGEQQRMNRDAGCGLRKARAKAQTKDKTG
ncbi:hypothetical protein K438DRAFT_1760861 [Mycena galopus ATCC 62051]|nr:hypothetical protein K438DRAFT_1760861 [Mycena galopus ATCC 62051]